MERFNSIINKYEGKGIPYRDRSDDIRIIVSNLARHIYSKDTRIVDELISQYKCFRYINDISVNGYNCVIDYDGGIVSFNVLPQKYFEHFCGDQFGFDDVNGRCHDVAERVLEGCHSNNVSAITSICINSNYMFYFHSYICDRKENKVVDFSKKIIMDKGEYDKLFCYKQLNDLNYIEYKEKLENSNYYGSLYPLLYLSLDELDDKKNVSSNKIGK